MRVRRGEWTDAQTVDAIHTFDRKPDGQEQVEWNPYSSDKYRSIQFTCRQMIRFANPLYERLTAAQAVAHTLKSSALLLGAAPLARVCEILMQLDEMELVRPKIDDVLQQATGAARWFQIWLANQTHR